MQKTDFCLKNVINYYGYWSKRTKTLKLKTFGCQTVFQKNMRLRLNFLIGLRCCSENVNSYTKIYDIDGNGMYNLYLINLRHQFYVYEKVGDLPNLMFDLERNGLKLKQAEWNILQMGTLKYETDCKQIRFKNVYLETTHLPIQKTIPLMTDQVIDVRINPTEIIFIIFLAHNRSSGGLHKPTIEFISLVYARRYSDSRFYSRKGWNWYFESTFHNIRWNKVCQILTSEWTTISSEWGEWSGICSQTCGTGTEGRSRTCSFDTAKYVNGLSSSKYCYNTDGCWSAWGGWADCNIDTGIKASASDDRNPYL